MTDRPNRSVSRQPPVPKRRVITSPPAAERARGLAADLRECIDEAVVNRDDLREIAGRLDALADMLGRRA